MPTLRSVALLRGINQRFGANGWHWPKNHFLKVQKLPLRKNPPTANSCSTWVALYGFIVPWALENRS